MCHRILILYDIYLPILGVHYYNTLLAGKNEVDFYTFNRLRLIVLAPRCKIQREIYTVFEIIY